jgi:hypothetical protein
MSKKEAPLEVIVQGGSIEASSMVYGVVQHALSEAGFTEVTASSPQGSKAAHVEKIPTMLDAVRAARPELFETPVCVRQEASAEDVASLIVDNPDQLDLGQIAYGMGEAGKDPTNDGDDANRNVEQRKDLEAVDQSV